MRSSVIVRGVAALAACLLAHSVANADDTLKLAVGQRGVFENSISDIGQRKGFFKKYGLELDILYTQSSGETQQAVISGAVDIGIAVGVLGALGAYAKGAPLRALGGTMRSAYEFWYANADSPIKTFKDAANKTVAYSSTGSSTHLMVLALQKHYGVTVRPVPTGGAVATLTQVLSRQVDLGWSVPPIGVKELQEGKIRIIAKGEDAPEFGNQTLRFIVVNATALENKPDLFRRYMQGYRDTLEWMYSAPDAIKFYAEWARISESIARMTRDEFIPQDLANPDKVSGLDTAMADAMTYKFISKPLSQEELNRFIQLQKPLN
jgi:NitT/TauT family transport system substrate-binding protein